MATQDNNTTHAITVVPPNEAPITLQAKFGDVVKIDFTKTVFSLPRKVFVGFDASENMRFQVDNPNVKPYHGFAILAHDNGTMSFPEEYLKEHVLYFTSDEKDAVLTMRLVLDV